MTFQKGKGVSQRKGVEFTFDPEYLQAKYGEALRGAPEAAAQQRAVYFANLAACHLRSGHYEDAVQDSAAALELDPYYVKALMRRSAAYEHVDDLEHALADSQKVLCWPRTSAHAHSTVWQCLIYSCTASARIQGLR